MTDVCPTCGDWFTAGDVHVCPLAEDQIRDEPREMRLPVCEACGGVYGSHTLECRSEAAHAPRLVCYCCGGTFPRHWVAVWNDENGCRCMGCEDDPRPCRQHVGRHLEQVRTERIAMDAQQGDLTVSDEPMSMFDALRILNAHWSTGTLRHEGLALRALRRVGSPMGIPGDDPAVTAIVISRDPSVEWTFERGDR